jgi:uncharacterized membrane protein
MEVQMAMRLQEVHPSLVHFPLTLLPLAVGADAIGRFTGNKKMTWLGRWGIAASAITGAVAGLAGLIAQEEVNVSGRTMDMLITHRNLNLAAVTAISALAIQRARVKEPSIPYLLGGLAAFGVVAYSGYIGGELVYRHGVGVEPAGGLWEGGGPELRLKNTGRVMRSAGRGLGMGFVHLGKETVKGKIVPTLTGGEPDMVGSELQEDRQRMEPGF